MNVLVDTHALFWFFASNKNLSPRAKEALLAAEKIFIPTIVLLELLYLVRKEGGEGKFVRLYEGLKNNQKYVLVSLDIGVVGAVVELPPTLDIHDRVIVATAQVLGVALISKDPVIQKVYKRVIW